MTIPTYTNPFGFGTPRTINPYVQLANIPEQYFQGLEPEFARRLRALDAAAPPGVFEDIGAISGYRSDEHQQRLWDSALQRYGSESAARQWVAPPGRSNHGGENGGNAVDLSYGSDAAREWVHANAATHGLHFPMSWENWHIEPVGPDGGRVARGGPSAAPGNYDPQRPISVFNQPAPPPAATAADAVPETFWDRLAGLADQNPFFGAGMQQTAPAPQMAAAPAPRPLQAEQREDLAPYIALFNSLRA